LATHPDKDPSISPLQSRPKQGAFSGSLELATTTLGFDFMSGRQQKKARDIVMRENKPCVLLDEAVAKKAALNFCCAGHRPTAVKHDTSHASNAARVGRQQPRENQETMSQISFMGRCGIGSPPFLRLMKRI
jgi:hypothetical protein